MARYDNTPDLTAQQPAQGGGSPHTRVCMGCNLRKSQTGSRGVGLHWRCLACVDKRRNTQ